MHLIERLEARRLVVRSPDPENFRAKLLSLTDKGKSALHDLYPLVEKFNMEGTKNISPDDLDIFKRVMAQIVQNVEGIARQDNQK